MKKQIFLIVILIIHLISTHAHGKTIKSIDDIKRIEPTVTRAEADVLNQSTELAGKNIKQAITRLLPFITAQSSAALDFALGNFYFQDNKLVSAEKAYRKALKKMPSFQRATANLVRIMIQQERLTEAKQVLKALLLEGIDNPSILTLIGYAYLLNSETIAAESAYRKAILLDSDDQNAYLGLAKALLIQKRYSESEQLIIELLEKYPQNGELWIHLANTRMAQTNISGAITALECSRRLKLATTEALATLGDLYLNNNQPKEAVARYQEAFAHKSATFFRMSRAIEGFIMIGDTKKAGALLKQVNLKISESTFKTKHLSQLLKFEASIAFLDKKYKNALVAFEKLLELEPLNGKVVLALGDVYKAMEDFNHALIIYERAARIDKVNVQALIRQAQLYVEREKYEKAVQLLEQAQMLEPQPYIERYLRQVRHLVR